MRRLIRLKGTATTVIALLAIGSSLTPPANAHCPHNGNTEHKHCQTGGGGDNDGDPLYDVALIAGDMNCVAPVFNPGDLAPPILASTVDQKGPGVSYSAKFPRHLSDGGPILTMDTGLQLADDIMIVVNTDEDGFLESVQIKGQPEIGKDALAHESEVVLLPQTVQPVNQSFYLAVNTDSINVWQLSKHTGGKRVEVVGKICLGEMIYTPQP